MAADVRLHSGVLAHGVLGGASAALLEGGAAGLAAVLGSRAIHLNAHQAALVVLVVLAALHLTFQTVHTRHLVFPVISRNTSRFRLIYLSPAQEFYEGLFKKRFPLDFLKGDQYNENNLLKNRKEHRVWIWKISARKQSRCAAWA